MIRCLASEAGRDWSIYHGDCVEVLKQLPDDSLDMAVYSPPFANLYTYSDTPRDMGNCNDDEQFYTHYRHLVVELLRTLRPGRLAAVHCSDLPSFKYKHGEVGLRDFSGELIRIHCESGFVYHSRITVWKCPVTEMQRTKALGLLYKQIKKDSTRSRVGMPDYVLIFRKGCEAAVVPVEQRPAAFPVEQWQEWASPVWMDIDQTDVLNVRRAREPDDERHMCPLQLGLIERLITLYSNPGEVVLSPFTGVGSEGVGALRLDRKFIGVELKESYFTRAAINLAREEGAEQIKLFG